MKNSFAENFLSREKRTFDNSIILHSFRWKCFIQWLNVNAVKESRKNIQILLSLISILGGKPASATYVSWKCCETWLSSKKSSYFRLKSKSYLINNQELTPFSLDINLKMFFHTVRGFFNTHITFSSCCKVLSSSKVENSFVEKENLSLLFVCLRFCTGSIIRIRKTTQKEESTKFLTPVIFRANRLNGGAAADHGVVYFIDRSYPK